MNRLLRRVFRMRMVSEIGAALAFVCFWPLANGYWVLCWAAVITAKQIGPGSVADVLAVEAVLLAFCVPLWVITVWMLYYLAIGLAVASLRPLPLVLALVAWLQFEGKIPKGHVSLGEVNNLIQGGQISWHYPLLYSLLAILCSALILLQRRRVSSVQGTNGRRTFPIW